VKSQHIGGLGGFVEADHFFVEFLPLRDRNAENVFLWFPLRNNHAPRAGWRRFRWSGFQISLQALNLGWCQKWQVRKISPEVSTIDRCEAVALDLGVGSHKKVWNEMITRSTLSAVFAMDAPGKVCGFRGKILIINRKHVKEMAKVSGGFAPRGEFGEDHWTNTQTAGRRCFAQTPLPSLEPGLLRENREDHRGIDGGDQGLAFGKVTVPRSSSKTSRVFPV
jgi:hypothetical protein